MGSAVRLPWYYAASHGGLIPSMVELGISITSTTPTPGPSERNQNMYAQ